MSSNVGILFAEGIEKNYVGAMKAYNPYFKNMFHVEKTSKRIIDVVTWQGYGLPKQRNPGQAIAMDQILPSFDKRFTMRYFGLGDSFAKEDLRDDLYGVLKRAVPSSSGMMAKMYNVLMEKEAAFFFGTQGFASGTTIAGSPDGRGLFNTAHPISKAITATTQSNRASTDTDMSYTVAQTMATALRTQLDHNGITILQNELQTVVFNPAQIYIAKAIWKSKMERGTADRNENFLPDDDVTLISWPYWQVSGATGTNNAFFGLAEEHSLYWYMRSSIDVDSDFDVTTKSQIVTTDVSFDYGHSDYRGTWASKGL